MIFDLSILSVQILFFSLEKNIRTKSGHLVGPFRSPPLKTVEPFLKNKILLESVRACDGINGTNLALYKIN